MRVLNHITLGGAQAAELLQNRLILLPVDPIGQSPSVFSPRSINLEKPLV